MKENLLFGLGLCPVLLPSVLLIVFNLKLGKRQPRCLHGVLRPTSCLSARRPVSYVVSHAASMGRTLVTIFPTRKATDIASTWCVFATLRAPVRTCATIKSGTIEGDPSAACLEIAICCALQKICPRDQVVVVQVSVAGYAPNTPQGIKAQMAIDWNATKV